MRMNVQGNLGAGRWKLRECRDADGQVVTDPGRFNDGLVGMLSQQLSAQMSNHAPAIVAGVGS